MLTKQLPIKSLIPHPRNVRQGDIGAIAESLKHHGQYRPIVVQASTNHILAGNHTWKAATYLGWDTIWATIIDCNDDEATRILLVDNRTNDIASYDDLALSDILKELLETDNQLVGTGFDTNDLDQLLNDISSDPIPPAEFPAFDESTPTEHECPKCHYKWSGKT